MIKKWQASSGKRLRLELDPQINEKRRQFCEIMAGSLSQEEREVKRKESAGLMADLLDTSNVESFVDRPWNEMKSRSLKR